MGDFIVVECNEIYSYSTFLENQLSNLYVIWPFIVFSLWKKTM